MKYVQQMHTRALTISNEYLALVKWLDQSIYMECMLYYI